MSILKLYLKMERFTGAGAISLFLFVVVLSVALGKDLHMKEYYIGKDSPDQALNLNLYDNYNTSHNERYVRHLKVRAVTETIISHLFNEIRHRDPRKANDPNLKKMMKNLKLRLKKYMHNKKPRHMKKMGKITGKL